MNQIDRSEDQIVLGRPTYGTEAVREMTGVKINQIKEHFTFDSNAEKWTNDLFENSVQDGVSFAIGLVPVVGDVASFAVDRGFDFANTSGSIRDNRENIKYLNEISVEMDSVSVYDNLNYQYHRLNQKYLMQTRLIFICYQQDLKRRK